MYIRLNMFILGLICLIGFISLIGLIGLYNKYIQYLFQCSISYFTLSHN